MLKTIVLVLACFLAAQAARAAIVEVSAGRYERHDTPVTLELPPSLAAQPALSLTEAASGRRVAVQRLGRQGRSLVWMLDEPLKAGETRRYRLEPQEAPAAAERQAVKVSADDRRVLVEVEGRPVLQYNVATLSAPEGIEPFYARSGHIHPLFNPAGQAVTDDFPPDHAHQHGMFFAWVNTTFEGRALDFWNQATKTARISHVALGGTETGPVCGGFTARLRHDDLTAPGGPKPVLNETWRVRVYNLEDVFLLDFESTQRTAGKSPLAINEYHYGGMAFRGAREWFGQPESNFLTSEGKTRDDGNHSRARWVEIHGRVDGKPSGAIVISHPENRGYPEPVRLHPQKPYFCFAPMVLGQFAIEPGRAYNWRYRVAVHMGQPDQALADRLARDFVEPPQVRLATEE